MGCANIAVNVTGGNVLMSLGAFMAAEEAGKDSLYISADFELRLKKPDMRTARITVMSRQEKYPAAVDYDGRAACDTTYRRLLAVGRLVHLFRHPLGIWMCIPLQTAPVGVASEQGNLFYREALFEQARGCLVPQVMEVEVDDPGAFTEPFEGARH